MHMQNDEGSPGVGVSRILPPSEGETTQITLRIPKKLLHEVDSIAKSTGHNRTDVMLHFVRWATQEYRAEQRQAEAAADGDGSDS